MKHHILFQAAAVLVGALVSVQTVNAQVDSSSVELVSDKGALSYSETRSYSMKVGSGSEKLVITLSALDRASVRLVAPGGYEVSSEDANVNIKRFATSIIYEITGPAPGAWALDVNGNGDYSVSAFTSSYFGKTPAPVASTSKITKALGQFVPLPPKMGLRVVPGTMITTGTAISKNGKPVVWGFRGSAQQGNGRGVVASIERAAEVQSLNDIVSFVGGAYHLIALDGAGNVYGWGQSGYGETGCPGAYPDKPCLVLKNAKQIATGEYFSIALDKTGQVWTWGHNLYGQLGNGRTENSLTPNKVNLNGEKARLIGGAYEGAFAVTEEGNVWAWGDNEASGLGFQGTNYGVQSIVRYPVQVPKLKEYAHRIVEIAGGNGWGEALLNDGTVIGWGLRAAIGQGILATNVSSPDPVFVHKNVKKLFARYVGSVALTHSGEIYTWGQTGGSAFPMIYGAIPTLRPTADYVADIGGGKEHVFYSTVDGRFFGVGYNDLNKLDQTRCCGPNVDWPGSEIDF